MKSKIKVYFDGLCKLCSKEIAHYQKQRGADDIEFIDICSRSFDPTKEGLDPQQVHRVMHVRRTDGSLATRVDAFIEIWQVLPKYRRLAKIAKNPAVRRGLNFGYNIFATVRPWLPRNKANEDCQESPYCEIKKVWSPK